MAQRQGLLTGRHLSPVQFKGIVILDWIERRDRDEREFVALKRSLIASGEWKPEKLFPDRFAEDTGEAMPDNLDVETDQGKLGVDYTHVEWKMPSNAEDEYYELMRQIGQASQGVMTGDEMVLPRDDGWR